MGHAMITLEQKAGLQIGLDKLFGLTHHMKTVPGAKGLQRVVQGAPLPEDCAAFKNLQEAYVLYSGDTRLDHFGRRTTQVFSDESFTSALANTLNRLLLKDFAPAYRFSDIVTSTTNVPDFRQAERVRLGRFDDLYDVGEDGTYNEVVNHGDESVSFSVIQKGATLTITRRALINNDVGAIARAVEQLGRAAFRALAKRVWNKIINNDVYTADGLPMFDAAHGNLGAAALSPSSLTAARVAMFNQSEQGSTEPIGLSGPFLLVVPIGLEAVALPINTSRLVPGTATFEGNPWFEKFGENSERIFSNPLFADGNDWYLFDVSGNVGLIEVGFLMGKQTPQIFLADAEPVGEMMNQDRLKYKLRFEFEASISDFRGSYKAVVA